MARIFLDTSVLKYSVDQLTRLIKVAETLEWPDGTQWNVPQYRVGTIHPNEKLPLQQREETYNLPFFAHLARRGKVKLLCYMEVLWELAGLPNIDDPRGRFYGAPIEMVEAPFKYSRILAGPDWLDCPTGKYTKMKASKRRAVEFFERVEDPRFKQLQLACGAHQGKRVAPNQLLDAFHVYCAEAAGADYFLTCDRNLVRQIQKHRRYPPKCRS